MDATGVVVGTILGGDRDRRPLRPDLVRLAAEPPSAPTAGIGFVKLWESLLAPGGIAVFTAYGRTIADELLDGSNSLNLEPQDIAQVLRDYDEQGVGFHTTGA